MGPWGIGAGPALLAMLAAFLWRRAAVRWRIRSSALAAPFPDGWRRHLLDWCDHYARLPEGLRVRFEDDLRIVLAEKRITGIRIEVSDELRLLVAASAVTLSLGWPDAEWDQLTEVLLYPDDFDRDYQFGSDELAGQAHPWGTVILSVPTLCASFQDPDDGYHVGFHEFAHLLDLEHARFDGIPAGFSEAQASCWVQIREHEMQRMLHGDSVLDDYGAHDPVEFFAVSVEAFFETALALRRACPDLYELLATYFRQDPAGWDDARGLRLEPLAPPRSPRSARRRRR